MVPEDRTWLCRAKGARAWPVPKTDSADALRQQVQSALTATRARMLLVDTFPRGVLGELDSPLIAGRRTLLVRLFRDLERQAAAICRYDHVLDIEPNLAWRPASISALELGPIAGPRAPAEARGALLFAWDQPSWAFLRRLQLRLHQRGHRAWVVKEGRVYQSISATPAKRRLLSLPARGVELVVGAAGYNLCYEALSANVPHLAIPRARSHDDQALRATRVALRPSGPRELEDRALAILGGERSAPLRITPISARRFARALLELWSSPPAQAARIR